MAASEARWPPEEKPETATKDGSNLYFAALALTKRITPLMSWIWAGNLASWEERWFGHTTA